MGIRWPGRGIRRLVGATEEARLIAAIRAAERDNRGEVQVHLEEGCPGEAVDRAAALFAELGLAETRDGTGVLLYLAIRDRKAAVYAGHGVHGAAAPDFWQSVIDRVSEGFAAGDGIAGLEVAIGRIGELLRQAAPGDDEAGNELPDRVTS